jgi:TetR/AcrR family transcriptional regulator, cholesterol catabolism regulator
MRPDCSLYRTRFRTIPDLPTTSSSARRTYSPDATRRAILDSALALFEANGFHATSVQSVADEADVTKGAFYHHFGSKDELVHIIDAELLDHMLREVRGILERVEGPEAQLRAVIGAIVASTVRYRSHVAVYYQERRYLDDARFHDVRRKRDELVELKTGIVRAGIRDGTFRDLDPTVVALGINGMAAWTHQWLAGSSHAEPEQVADLLADMVLGGLRRA